MIYDIEYRYWIILSASAFNYIPFSIYQLPDETNGIKLMILFLCFEKKGRE